MSAVAASALHWVTPEIRVAIYDHAHAEQPAECCGLLVHFEGEPGARYVPALNLLKNSTEPDQFRLDEATLCQVEDAGAELLAVVHSHPNASANPSMADRAGCERSGLPWLIVGWPSGALVEVLPSGWVAPLEGREYAFGMLDCYTLIQDYYRRALGITLPDFERDGFWAGADLYRTHLDEAGFDLVNAHACPPDELLVAGDVLLLRVQSPDVDNHVGVYVGDGYMLHHPYGHTSRRVRFDEPWRRRCFGVARHRQVSGKGV